MRKSVLVMASVGVLGAAFAAMCLLGGCATFTHLTGAVSGHLSLINSAKPVREWIDDPATSATLRARLELSQRMRDFAVTRLKLPDNQSYRRYADLGRNASVWNVVAAPELSLKLKTWCFPFTGCIGYKGYYNEADAQAFAKTLASESPSDEVNVYPVSAYSTLGKLEWLGGDPLLNTFVNQSEGWLAGLMFHELAHQLAYAQGDTAFNESFATAVERIGLALWLDEHASATTKAQHERQETMRREFRTITAKARAELQALFASNASDADKRAGKARIYQSMRDEHARVKAERWGGKSPYDAWFERANNAMLALSGSYNDLVPAFEQLYIEQGRSLDRFYAEAKRLADLPSEDRRAIMERLRAKALAVAGATR